MVDKVVLILTNSKDGAHTDSVVHHLEKIGWPFFRLNVDEVARGDTKIIVSSNKYEGLDFVFSKENGETVSSRNIGSAWYRRPF